MIHNKYCKLSLSLWRQYIWHSNLKIVQYTRQCEKKSRRCGNQNMCCWRNAPKSDVNKWVGCTFDTRLPYTHIALSAQPSMYIPIPCTFAFNTHRYACACTWTRRTICPTHTYARIPCIAYTRAHRTRFKRILKMAATQMYLFFSRVAD